MYANAKSDHSGFRLTSQLWVSPGRVSINRGLIKITDNYICEIS